MVLAVAGHSNKQIGGKLEIGDVTARAHRRQVMRKIQAKSLTDLIRMVDLLAQRGVEL